MGKRALPRLFLSRMRAPLHLVMFAFLRCGKRRELLKHPFLCNRERKRFSTENLHIPSLYAAHHGVLLFYLVPHICASKQTQVTSGLHVTSILSVARYNRFARISGLFCKYLNLIRNLAINLYKIFH